MKAYWGSEGIAPSILNLGTDKVELSALRLAPLPPGKETLLLTAYESG